jgi:hypothetical protein
LLRVVVLGVEVERVLVLYNELHVKKKKLEETVGELTNRQVEDQ